MQNRFSVNLNAATFPFWSKLQSRTVLVGRLDQSKDNSGNTARNTKLLSKEDGLPEAYYMHNVIPTSQGYRSVSFYEESGAYSGGETFVDIITIKSQLDPVAFLASTTTGKYLLYIIADAVWVDVTPAGASLTDITIGFSSGVSYICLANFNIYTIDLDTPALVPANLTGITVTAVTGISSSNNYLLLHDGQTVFWSSATDPTDFVPSIITGAGAGIPSSSKGEIKLIVELNTGYGIYTTTNIVVAAFSGNTRFPWIFKEAVNGAGISSIYDVTGTGDAGANYAWTSAGLLRVTQAGAKADFPEFTDFLSARVMEDFDSNTKTLDTTFLTENLLVKLLYSSSRYLVVSYGITGYTHVLIYDTALRRLGKLKLAHVKAFEFQSKLTTVLNTYQDLTGMTYQDLTGTIYGNIDIVGNSAADPRRLLSFLLEDGSIKVAVFDYGDFTSEAVIIFGKYQLTRNSLVAIQEIEVESINTHNDNFDLSLMSSLDGKNVDYPLITPYKTYDSNNVKKYLANNVAINHSILIEGAFNLVSLTLSATQEGRP